MFRLIGLGLCVLLGGAQDPADKVKALVEKLKYGELAVREQAHVDLLKLEPAALPALRGHLAEAEGEFKARLQSIVRKIERDDRVARIMAPGPRITLKVKERPAPEVVAEISRQAGVRVEGGDLPSGALLSLDADRLSLPDAIDEICRRHGGIVAQWSASRVRLVPGPWRKRPVFDAGPYRFIPDGFVWSVGRGGDAYSAQLVLKGVVLGPPGRLPPLARLDLGTVIDEEGEELGDTKHWGLTVGSLEWPLGQSTDMRFGRLVCRRASKSPSLDASKLVKCRGIVRLSFICGFKRIDRQAARVKTEADWEAERKEKRTYPRSGVTVKRFSRSDRALRIDYWAYHHPADRENPDIPPLGPTWVALHDAAGRRLEGMEVVEDDYLFRLGTHVDRGGRQSVEGSVTFNLPEGFEPATVDLMEATEIDEIQIPFDLGEVRLK